MVTFTFRSINAIQHQRLKGNTNVYLKEIENIKGKWVQNFYDDKATHKCFYPNIPEILTF